MKQCPLCRQIFRDQFLMYCMNDGQPLTAVLDPHITSRPGDPFSPPSTNAVLVKPPATKSRKVGFIVVAALTFLSLAVWLIWKPPPKPVPNVEDYKQELIQAIRRADNAESEAGRTLDTAGLSRWYKGDALKSEEESIALLIREGIYVEATLENQQIDSYKLLQDGKRAEVRLTETWSSVYYRKSDNRCLWKAPSHAAPQTITLERNGDSWIVVAIVHELNQPEPAREYCSEPPPSRTHYNDDDAGISYELPQNWTVNSKENGKLFTSPDGTMLVAILTSRDRSLGSDFVKMLSLVAEFVDDPKLKNGPVEGKIGGMQEIKFSGEGYRKGERFKWGFNIIEARKPLIILSLVDAEHYQSSVDEYKAFFSSIRALD